MKYEVGIIGCGVAGMTAAIYLKRSGISCAIFESSMPGGQIVANDKIENYPGFSKISGSDLAISILNQVKELEIPVIFEKVEKIDNKGVEKEIVTDKNKYSTLRVIIATGRKSKKLNVLFEDKYFNHGLSFCAVCDGSLYKDKDVVVVGGGDSALESAIYLSPIVKSVTILHRRDKLRAKKTLVNKAEKLENVSFRLGEVLSFIGEDNLEGVKLKSEEVINCEAVFICIGQTPNTEFLNNMNILSKDSYIEVDDNFETKQKGIYAVGDCVFKPHYQIVIAMSEAARCALRVREDIHE